MNSTFVGYEELSRSRRVLSTEAENTLFDLLNSSYPTQPYSLITTWSQISFAAFAQGFVFSFSWRVIHGEMKGEWKLTARSDYSRIAVEFPNSIKEIAIRQKCRISRFGVDEFFFVEGKAPWERGCDLLARNLWLVHKEQVVNLYFMFSPAHPCYVLSAFCEQNNLLQICNLVRKNKWK